MASQPIPMGRFWKEASDLFFRRPVLWVPVLVADLIGSSLDQGQLALVRAIVNRGLQYHSVLGATVQERGLSLQAAQHASMQALAVAWCSYFVRILFYVAALVITASLVGSGERRNAWRTAFAELRRRPSGVVFLTLRALAVYAFAAVSFRYLITGLTRQHSPLPHAAWFRVLCAAVLAVLLVAVVAAPALRLLTEPKVPSEHGQRSARIMALLMALASLGLAFFAGQSAGGMLRAGDGRTVLLGMLASLLTAVPYILLFIGYGVIAEVERHADETA